MNTNNDCNEAYQWITDAERWIGQIKGVLRCTIDVDDLGEISTVHVISSTQREPRHIVRDVESLLKARLDLDVYYKKIGVVQVLEDEDAPFVPSTTETDFGPSESIEWKTSSESLLNAVEAASGCIDSADRHLLSIGLANSEMSEWLRRRTQQLTGELE